MPQREPQNESTSPNGPRASSGLVPRSVAKVPHVVVQSRSLEDASSPRGAPSQRPGDNSTKIIRTTAKWHSTPAPKSRFSSPDEPSWVRPLRDDARRREPRGYSGAEVTLQAYVGGRSAFHASEALRRVRPSMVTGSTRVPTRDSRSVSWTRTRTLYAEPPLSKLLREYRNNPLAVHSN